MEFMNNNNFFMEILVQELPYQFIPSAESQLKDIFTKLLEENKLGFNEIKTYATPRRLALLITGLDASQEDIIKDVKGPILNVALDANGEYSKAAIGFANKNNAPLTALYQKDNYIWVKIEQKGKSAKEILCLAIKNAILKLQGSHFMRWGYFEEKFSRPIENLVALYNNEVLDVEIFDKKATDTTFGHRFAPVKEIKISNPLEYVELMKKVCVYVDSKERKQLIIDSAKKKAEEIGCTIDFSELDGLLDEVTYITEYPIPVVCEFKEDYLKIPDIVTTTVMAVHQRYFPLYEKSGKLSNKFITMANFVGCDEDAFDNIRKGNQRVISARLEDGKFFFDDDIKTPLVDRLEELKGMTFQRGLGTLYDKTERIVKLSDYIADSLNISDKTDILRSAKLSKADLSTKLVFEFTELQGFIGEKYAQISGEKENVALAIKEHYFPLSSGSDLPSSIEGQIVSIADKMDTIAAVFISTQGDKKKKRPTGSNDPLAVRRAIIGVLRTVISNNMKIDIEQVAKKAIELVAGEFQIEIAPETLSEMLDFMYARLGVMYEKSYDASVLAACKNTHPLSDLVDWLKRMDAVSEFTKSAEISDILEAINRVLRITQGAEITASVDESLFTLDEEKALYTEIKAIPNLTYSNITEVKKLIQPLKNYFDKVLVMDKDEKIKNNRLATLKTARDKFNKICDFSKIG